MEIYILMNNVIDDNNTTIALSNKIVFIYELKNYFEPYFEYKNNYIKDRFDELKNRSLITLFNGKREYFTLCKLNKYLSQYHVDECGVCLNRNVLLKCTTCNYEICKECNFKVKHKCPQCRDFRKPYSTFIYFRRFDFEMIENRSNDEEIIAYAGDYLVGKLRRIY